MEAAQLKIGNDVENPCRGLFAAVRCHLLGTKENSVSGRRLAPSPGVGFAFEECLLGLMYLQ